MRAFRLVRRTSVLSMLLFSLSFAGTWDHTVRAFENNPEYVRPFATLLGTMTNAGWYYSSSVPRGFGFYVGLPISLTYLADKDLSFKSTYVDEGCVTCNEVGGISNGCQERYDLTLPTVFGPDAAPVAYQTQIDLQGNFSRQDMVLFSDGVDPLVGIPLFPYASLQLGFSLYHAELKLRYMGVPAGPVQVHFPGFGAQYDFTSLLPPMPVPVSLSAAANMTLYSARFTPGDNIDGTLELGGLSSFVGILAGYRLGFLELFLETGWEHSHLSSGGELTIYSDNGDAPDEVRPDLTLTGRNGIRAALNIALPLGYRPVLSQSIGAEMGQTINILGYSYRSPE